MTTRVVIVRHGQSSYNTQQLIQGRCDESILTEKGRTDAQKVGAALSNLRFDAFYSSPLQRATETAEIIHACLETPPLLQVADKLAEVDLPLWEKQSKQEVQAKFPEDYRCWKSRPHEFRMLVPTPAGKQQHYPVLSLYEQAQQFWHELLGQHQGGTVLIVAHNGINRCLISSAIGISPSRYHTIRQSNGGISVLNFTGGWGDPVQLESLNQTAHSGVALPEKPSQGLRLLLVRHGETEWNYFSRYQGRVDIPLNDKGREQARKVAEFLKDVSIDFAITSPMVRPTETAEAILEHHPHLTLERKPRLTEINHGLWEGKLEEEIKAEYADILRQWKEAPARAQMPEGENLQQVWDRAIACWQDLVQAANADSFQLQTGVIVAHDAINKVILCYLLGLKPENFWNVKQGNGAVSVIDYPQADDLPVLQTINITTHLSQGVFDSTAAGAL
ncbi:MAG: histidine phosphatase family protein [Cyanobacteria bacterium QS_4_48_99]|nr:MAG: histidine phosphatase family protein [Cyanobacteria bacterium QS_4_48_99]